MELISLFTISGAVILLGFLSEYIFDKTEIPDAVWLILIGLLLGHLFPISNNEMFRELGLIFTTFALIFILFEGVLNINFNEFFKSLGGGTVISLTHFIFTMLITGLSMMILGWGLLEGLLLGAILADSAQAVIIPIIKKIKMKDETALILTFESAISDVFCIVGALTILNIFVLNAVSFTGIVQKIGFSFVFGIIFGAVAALIWINMLPLLNKISKSYMTTIAVLLLVYSGVEYLGASGALACLSFGIVMGNSRQIFSAFKKESEYDMETSAKFFYSQISFFLKTFFFVYVGVMIDLKQLDLVIIGGLLALLIFLIRPLSVMIGFSRKPEDIKDRTYLEVLNPKGLSAVVLAQLPAQFGVPHGEEFSMIVMSVVVFSIFITLIGVFLTEKGFFRGSSTFFRKKHKLKNEHEEKKEQSDNKNQDEKIAALKNLSLPPLNPIEKTHSSEKKH